MSAEYRQTSTAKIAIAPDNRERAMLLVCEGDGPLAKTRVIELPATAHLTIGRTHQADIQIDSEAVSREHASISRNGLEIAVVDHKSRNGTFVNGTQITGKRRLASGDAVVIGPATIVVSMLTYADDDERIHTIRDLEERLASEIDRAHAYGRVFALARIRISGHAAAVDAAIHRVAAATRPMDFVAEYAPSELAILLPELDAQVALDAAHKLATAARGGAAAQPIELAIGVALFPRHGTTTGDLIARAGAAMSTGEIALPPVDELESDTLVPIAIDPVMRRVYELVRMVARHPITVLINGETGVGKEVVAATIHRSSDRREAPMVRLNCASLPDSLLESELFGHERGAFTGADRRKVGYFEIANGGTLFLDEIGELPLATQVKLLRVLEAKRITRIGGTDEIDIDVRVVCATNKDLEAEVARGAFRSDLLYRIAGFTILVPPLRDRPDEILPLAERFLVAAANGRRPPTLSPAAEAALRRYAWPGNVRELRNAIERAHVIQQDGEIQLEDLPDRVRGVRVPTAVSRSALWLDGERDVRDHIGDLEKDAIVAALEACKGSQTEAAKKLGVSRRALIYRMEKYGLKPQPPGAKR